MARISYPSSALKPGTVLPEDAQIQILSAPKYVSRGGEKLAFAFNHWNVTVKNKICLDVGTSTGGFTDYLLQHGAQKVYAVDVGHGQIHPKLRNDPRVEIYEKTHILKWQPPWLTSPAKQTPNFFTVDVSFISLKLVLPRIFELFQIPIEGLILIKPQFEVGPKYLRKGIVKDVKARAQAIEKIIELVSEYHFELVDHVPCEILGIKGNQEEWLYVTKNLQKV